MWEEPATCDDDDDTFRTEVNPARMSSGKKHGCVQGPASWPQGPPTKPRKPFERPLAQRVISGGNTHVCQPSEGKRVNCSPCTATCVCELQSVPFQPRMSQPRLSRKRRDAPLDKARPTLQLFPPEVLTSSTSHNIALRGLETQSDCHPHHHQPRHSHDENNDWPRRHHSLTPFVWSLLLCIPRLRLLFFSPESRAVTPSIRQKSPRMLTCPLAHHATLCADICPGPRLSSLRHPMHRRQREHKHVRVQR